MDNGIIYEYITEYIRQTIAHNNKLLQELENYAEENHVPIIQPEVAKLIGVAGQLLKPKKILEIGTAIGYSAILMSNFLQKDGKITTIERYSKMIEEAKKNIERAGLKDTISILEGEAEEILPTLNEEYDLVFIDAAKGQYLEFLNICMKLLRPGGLLISDNILYKGMIATDNLVIRRKKTIVKRMRDYLKYICNHEQLETSIIPIGDGVALSFKRS